PFLLYCRLRCLLLRSKKSCCRYASDGTRSRHIQGPPGLFPDCPRGALRHFQVCQRLLCGPLQCPRFYGGRSGRVRALEHLVWSEFHGLCARTVLDAQWLGPGDGISTLRAPADALVSAKEASRENVDLEYLSLYRWRHNPASDRMAGRLWVAVVLFR